MYNRKPILKKRVHFASLEKLLSIGQSLTSAQDLKSLLCKIVALSGELLNADIVTLYEYWEETDSISVPPVIWGALQNPEHLQNQHRLRSKQPSLVFKLLEQEHPLYATDAARDWSSTQELQPEEGPEGFIHREGIASSAGVRLRANNQKLGALFINYRAPHFFKAEEKEIIEFIAVQAALAIYNARLIEQERTLRRQAEILYEVTATISAARGLKDVAEKILEALSQVIPYRKSTMQLIKGDTRKLIAYRGFDENSVNEWLLRPISQDPLIHELVTNKKPLILSHTAATPAWEIYPETQNVHSWVGIPLIYGEQVVGLLTLDHDQAGFYTSAIENLLVLLGNQAATAIYKDYLLEGSRRQIARYRVLNEVGALLVGLSDEEAILDRVADQAAQTLECKHCTVFRVEGDELVIMAAYGTRAQHLNRGRIFKVGQGVAGWVAQHGQSVLVSNTREDPRFDDTWSSPPPLALVDVPILLDQKVYGVISAENSQSSTFDEQDLQLLTAFALQVSQAVRNSRRIRELEALNQAGHLINSQRATRQLFEIVLDIVNETLKCVNSTFFLMEPTGELRPFVRRGNQKTEISALRFHLGEGLVGWVAQNRLSQNISDVDRHPQSIPSGRPHSMLLAPLIVQDRVVGVISADKDILNGFDESDLRLLNTLSDQVAIAYENARLFEQLSRLQSISTQLMTLDLDALSELIITNALKLTQIQTGFGIIYLLNDDGTRITKTVGGPDQYAPSRFSLSEEGLTRIICETGKPMIVSDTNKVKNISEDVDKWGIKSFIGQPLKAGKRVIGVLYLNDMKLREFTPSDLELITLLASQAAIAIENAQNAYFYQQREKDTTALQKIVGTIGAEINPLPVILKAIVELFELADYGAIALGNPHKSPLIFKAIWENGNLLVDLEIPLNKRTCNWKTGLMEQVAREGRSAWAGDVAKIPDYQPWRTTTLSELAVPLKDGQGQVMGILNLASPRRNAFDRADQSLCEGLANVATIAIEKGNLYDNLQRRARYLDTLNRVANRTDGVSDRREMFLMIVHEARETLNATRCTLFIVEGNVLVPDLGEGVPEEIFSQFSFRIGEGLGGWVAKEGLSQLVLDVEQDPRFVQAPIPTHGIFRSMILTPLWLEGQVMGVISLDRDGGLPFDETDLRFLETLSVQAGIFERQRQRRIAAINRRYNPYVAGAPIRAPEGFFGRMQLIRSILDSLPNNNLLIHGERRIGKTSLLMNLEHHLQTLSQKDKVYYFLPIFIDLQKILQEDFFLSLRQEIELRARIPTELLTDPTQTEIYDHVDLEMDLETIIEFLEAQHSGREIRLVLLMDEMDQFIGYNDRTQECFRSLLMSPCGAYLRIIMAGVKIQRVQHTLTSPWYNLFEEKELQPFDETEARQLITEPVQGYYLYDSQALDTLLRYSDFKPFDIQRLCLLTINAMLDRLSTITNRLTPESHSGKFIVQPVDVLNAVEIALQEKAEEYFNIWSNFSEIQQSVIKDTILDEEILYFPPLQTNGTPLFTRESLRSIVRFAGEHAHLTHLFLEWWRKGAQR